jgi:hypothetical protein
MKIDVLYTHEASPGWAPITHMARLAAESFGGKSLAFDSDYPARLRRLLDLRARKQGTSDAGLCAILRAPSEMLLLRRSEYFRKAYAFVAIWIIDSFRHEHLPPRRAFADLDFVGYMRPNDETVYRRMAGRRAHLLGWGSDVLRYGSERGDRGIDVLRVGRQPPEWDDDLATTNACKDFGLAFRGRPPLQTDPAKNQLCVMEAMSHARFVIAHSNVSAPSYYTHPTAEYLTARWTDALACGATVAGSQPNSDRSMTAILWPGATLHFDRIDLRHNLQALQAAKLEWTPGIARRNYLNALRRLDWRWRFKKIADQFGISFERLDAELGQLNPP